MRVDTHHAIQKPAPRIPHGTVHPSRTAGDHIGRRIRIQHANGKLEQPMTFTKRASQTDQGFGTPNQGFTKIARSSFRVFCFTWASFAVDRT